MCILEKLNVKIYRGSMPLDPPSVPVPSEIYPILAGTNSELLPPGLTLLNAAERSEAAKPIPVIIESFCPSMNADLCPDPLTRTGLWVYLTSPVQGFVSIFDVTNFWRPFLHVLQSLVRSQGQGVIIGEGKKVRLRCKTHC